MKKRSFYYIVLRLLVDPLESVIKDERHFPTVTEARTYARQTPDGLRAFVFRMNADSVMIV